MGPSCLDGSTEAWLRALDALIICATLVIRPCINLLQLPTLTTPRLHGSDKWSKSTFPGKRKQPNDCGWP